MERDVIAQAESKTDGELQMTSNIVKPINVAGCTVDLTSAPLRPSDQSLVQAAKIGHSTSFDALCERHAHRLFRVAYRITRNREDAEDAVQNALLSAFVHLTAFEDKSSVATWLTRITMNSALMILRKKRASPVELIENANVTGDLNILYRSSSPEEACSSKEQERILIDALNTLRPDIRKTIELRELQGLTTKETAQVLGVTISAVKARVFHGRGKLREALSYAKRQRIYGGQWNRARARLLFQIPHKEQRL
jgi:RNA polymerase sigma factor (sigma-70 family)